MSSTGQRNGALPMRRLLPPAWYGLLTVLFTWPLAAHPFSLLGALHGPGDPYLNLWILGWDLQTISTQPLDLLSGRVFDANIFHPARQTLAYSDHFLVVALLAWPVYAIAGSVVASYNAVLLGSLLGSALAMHLFVRQVTGSTWGALAAGTIWGFWSYRFAHLGHLQLQALYALPLAFLCLHWLVAGARRADAVRLGLAGAFLAATSVYYGVIGAVGIGVACLVLLVATGGRRAARLAGRLLLAGAIGVVLVAPVVWPYVQVQQREGFARNLFEAARHAAVPGSYLSVPEVNAVYGTTGLLVTLRGAESELFPGALAIALAIGGLAVASRRGSWPLAAAAVAIVATGFVLSLGPDGFRPLYAAMHSWVFGFQAIRAPARFAVLVTFGLATLAALAVRDLSGLRHGAWICGALVLLIALEYMPGRLHWVPAPPIETAASRWLAAEPASGAVLYLPLTNDLGNTPFMVESLAHRRPIVNGYSGQRPAFFSGAVDALATFPSVEAAWMVRDLDVRFLVSPEPVDTNEWPFVERARVTEADGRPRYIYELAWSPEVEARLGEPSTPVPPDPGPPPFAPGELLQYDVIWDGPAGRVSAGTVTVSVEAAPEAGFHFDVRARTAPWIARFFEADDRFTTTVDASLLPRVHERRLREGRRAVDQRVRFDHPEGVAQVEQGGGEAGPPIRLWPQARDAVSTLFYVRSLPLAPGSRVQVPVVENGRHSVLDLKVEAIERLEVSGRTIPCLRIDADLKQRVQRRTPPDITVWLERDGARRLVAADVRAVFGNLRVQLAR